ncbi:MAG: conjugal transfer protein TraI, partial [Pseudomonadota bacterium]
MSETLTDTAAAMRLRADPPRVTRISRKVIVGIGVVAGLGIGAALIYGLQRPDRTAAPEELITTDRRQPADGLRDLPGSYDAIPRLGPPLPGDLGGGILDAQQRGQPIAAPSLAPPTMDPSEQQRFAELEAARVSALFFQTRPGGPASTGFQMPPASPGGGMAATPETDPRH